MRSVKIPAVLMPLWLVACAQSADAGLDNPDAGDPCDQLVLQGCGGPEDPATCKDSSACEASRLTARYERSQCTTRLADARYQCADRQGGPLAGANQDHQNACTDLTRKTCGPQDECNGQDTCVAAKELVDVPSCTQALVDETSFPPCVLPDGGSPAAAPGGSSSSSGGNGGGGSSSASGTRGDGGA